MEEHTRARAGVIREVLRAQRDAVYALRNGGEIGDDTMHRLERELDLEELQLDAMGFADGPER